MKYNICILFKNKRPKLFKKYGGKIMEDSKKIKWYGLAFMAFSTVWGFGNVLNLLQWYPSSF